MIFAAMRIFTGLLKTFLGLKIFRMVFSFIKAVTFFTAQSIFAASLVVNYRLFGIPLLTRVAGIDDLIRLAPKILPIVSIDTGRSIVGINSLCVGTPYCFVVKHIEVVVFYKFLYQVDRDLLLRVRKWTVLSIFTERISLKKLRAKFSFKFIWMIKLLNPVVWKGTNIPLRASFFLGDIGTEFRFVFAKFSSSIFSIFMVVWAFF